MPKKKAKEVESKIEKKPLGKPLPNRFLTMLVKRHITNDED